MSEQYNLLLTKLNRYRDENEDKDIDFLPTIKDLKFKDIINIIGHGGDDIKLLVAFLLFNNETTITANEFILLKLLVFIRMDADDNISNKIDNLINKKLKIL